MTRILRLGRKRSLGGRTSVWSCCCPLDGALNTSLPQWVEAVLGFPSCLVSSRHVVLHLFTLRPWWCDKLSATAPSHGQFFIIFLFSFRGTQYDQNHLYPQHCQQREGNTSVGSHGPVGPNKEHREEYFWRSSRATWLKQKEKRPAAGSAWREQTTSFNSEVSESRSCDQTTSHLSKRLWSF